MPRRDKRERVKRTERMSIRPHELNLPKERGVFNVKCGKVKYKDEAEASEALSIIYEYSKSKKRPCQVYKCWICKGYHLTSKPF